MTSVASSNAPSPFPSLKSLTSADRLRHPQRPRSTGSNDPGSRTASNSLSSPFMPSLDLNDSSHPLFSSLSPHSCASPAPSDASSKLLSAYPDATLGQDQFFIDTSALDISEVGLYMPQSFDFSHGRPASMSLPLADEAYADSFRTWGPSTVGASGVANSASNGHRRQQSSSSIGSTGASSVSAYQSSRVGDYEIKGSSQSYKTNHLPTPTGTPTRIGTMHSNKSHPPPSQNLASSALSPLAMPTGLLGPQVMRQPASSLAEPGTPMTVVSDYTDDSQRRQTEQLRLDRNMQGVFREDFFYPPPAPGSQPPSHYLMSQSPVVANRLHAASNMARSASGSSSQSTAPLSAFKANAPYMHSQMGASEPRDPQDLHYAVSPHSDSEQKTISPQEALLDHEPAAHDLALFGSSSRNYSLYPMSTSAASQTFQTPTTISFSDNTGLGQWSSALAPSAISSAPMQYGGFAAPALPASMTHGLGSNSYLAPSARGLPRHTDNTPEFPAHLTSMDSSASEAPASSAASSARILSPPKPNTGADTGTYSCTYHNCAQRFSTPQKLQKHKRDVHRTTPNVTPGIGSGMSAAELMERNSQAGPHKCERINPGTGKPCNAIFSRPYDLTRHEDTIHNIRKQKSRCALCQEEKLFSRSDALTRHMRVVHPEVDFPGKYRRRGGARD